MDIFAAEWNGIFLRVLPLAEDVLHAPQLTADEEQALLAIRADSRRREWLASRWLVQKLLPGNTVCYSPHGKPFLDLYRGGFSISHSPQYVAIAFSDAEANVAVDVELVSNRVSRVRHKFLSAAEQEYCQADDAAYHTLLWCAKEVMFKLRENGSVDFENHYRVLPFVKEDTGEMSGIYSDGAMPAIEIHMYYLHIGDAVAVIGMEREIVASEHHCS